MKTTAIVLAAGSGRRMGSDQPKQYLAIHGKPLVYYSLAAFEKSSADEIILVTRAEDITYCESDIVREYGFEKVAAVIAGGAERYDSVWQGLQRASGDAVLIHDGARACIRTDLINRLIRELETAPALVAGVPVKDTIKVTNADGTVTDTPDRSTLWQVQTPQCFHTVKIREAFRRMYEDRKPCRKITDDAMVMELYGDCPVKMVMGDYDNIKVTTREDIRVVENILR